MEAETSIEKKNETDKPRPQFGDRYLTNPDDVFKHNAWDNVTWDDEQESYAKCQVAKNSSVRATSEQVENYDAKANEFWNQFYNIHENKFFKDRHWLFTEFPELLETKSTKLISEKSSSENSFPGSNASVRLLEVGCGAGNTVFPLLRTSNEEGLFVYACDFSKSAVEIVKGHDQYNTCRCHAFVHDITNDDSDVPFPHESLDFVILIFVLSAINPEKMQKTINRLASYLKPGGKILFRDYGRYDMAQLRFKPGRCITDNFYARGDGTKVYFFTEDEAHNLFASAGLVKEQCLVDRRLQVNRSKLLKMYRVWIQCKYVKPVL